MTGANLNEIAWEEIDLAAVDTFVGNWPADPIDDVVDSQYVDDACTMPLGPLLGEDWDPGKVGHPKIPPAERLDQSKKKSEKETPEPASGSRKGWGRDKAGTKPGGEPVKPSAPKPMPREDRPAPKPDQKLFRFVDYNGRTGQAVSVSRQTRAEQSQSGARRSISQGSGPGAHANTGNRLERADRRRSSCRAASRFWPARFTN